MGHYYDDGAAAAAEARARAEADYAAAMYAQQQEAEAREAEIAATRQAAQMEFQRLTALIEHYEEIISELKEKRQEVLCDL